MSNSIENTEEYLLIGNKAVQLSQFKDLKKSLFSRICYGIFNFEFISKKMLRSSLETVFKNKDIETINNKAIHTIFDQKDVETLLKKALKNNESETIQKIFKIEAWQETLGEVLNKKKFSIHHFSEETLTTLINAAADSNHSFVFQSLMTYLKEANETLFDKLKKEFHEKTEELIDENAELIKIQNAYEKGEFSNQQEVEALSAAASKGKLKIIKFFIEKKGFCVDWCEKNQFSLLIYASQNGHIELVDYLISKNVNVNFQDRYGYTALMYAANRGNEKIVERLIEKGADTNLQDKTGRTALMLAAMNNKDISPLITKETDLNLKDKEGFTLFHYLEPVQIKDQKAC